MDKFKDPKTGEELFRITDDNKELLTKKGKKFFNDKKEDKEDGTNDNNRPQHVEEG